MLWTEAFGQALGRKGSLTWDEAMAPAQLVASKSVSGQTNINFALYHEER